MGDQTNIMGGVQAEVFRRRWPYGILDTKILQQCGF